MFRKTVHFQIQKIKNNAIVFLILLASGSFVLLRGFTEGNERHAIAYLLTMGFCLFITDYCILKWPTKQKEIIVHRPAKENVYWLICTSLGLLFLIIHFSVIQHKPGKMINILIVMGLFLFMFPVVLLIIFLLKKYKLSQLGFRFQKILVAVPIITTMALVSFLVFPESSQWKNMYHQEGLSQLIFTGFIGAGLSEEFSRFIVQSRLGALLRNNGAGWFIASLIWALSHLPKIYFEQHTFMPALSQALNYIPLGLMWGYLSFRCKTIFPSVLIHGTNLWGFV